MSARLESDNQFWSRISTMETHSQPGKPVIIQGNTLFSSFDQGQEAMFSSCNLFAPIAKICLENLPKSVIDLGCGIGSNSMPLIERGVKVIAYEKMRKLLEVFASKVPQAVVSNVTLRRGDIATCKSFTKEGEKVDAVLCVDVLPYLPPSALQSTIKKISDALSQDGRLYGTMFMTPPGAKLTSVEFMQKLGASFLQKHEDVREILERSGFEIISLHQCQPHSAEPSFSYQFVAKKL